MRQAKEDLTYRLDNIRYFLCLNFSKKKIIRDKRGWQWIDLKVLRTTTENFSIKLTSIFKTERNKLEKHQPYVFSWFVNEQISILFDFEWRTNASTIFICTRRYHLSSHLIFFAYICITVWMANWYVQTSNIFTKSIYVLSITSIYLCCIVLHIFAENWIEPRRQTAI